MSDVPIRGAIGRWSFLDARAASRESIEAVPLHVANQRHAAAQVELRVDVVQVQLGGSLRDRKPAGYVLARHAVGDHARNLRFARREILRHRAYAGLAAQELVDGT